MDRYTVVIIGGGPGGYETAIRLSQYNVDVAVVESERLGGVCLNWGCIPTKTLVKSAELYSEMQDAESYGLPATEFTLDYSKVYERKNKVVEQLVSGIEYLFRKRKIPVVHAWAKAVRREGEDYVVIMDNGEELAAKYLIIATGSTAKSLPGMDIDEDLILSSTGILKLDKLPKSLAVVGGGVIGCEFASIFASFGVEVQIIEFLPRLIALEDEEISKRLTMAFKKAKIKVQTGTAVQEIVKTDHGARLKLSNDTEIEVEKVLMSVGRMAANNVDWQDLDLKTDKGAILIDEMMATSLDKVFAIGDVTAKLQLAHTASKQGLMVAERIKSELDDREVHPEPLLYENIPRCTFTHPEIGSVGLTEQEAKDRFGEILVGRFPFTANGKAMSMSNTFGFVKSIARADDGSLVGLHIIGPQAAELIAQGAILISTKATPKALESIVFAHPTLSEAIKEALEDLHNLSIHKI